MPSGVALEICSQVQDRLFSGQFARTLTTADHELHFQVGYRRKHLEQRKVDLLHKFGVVAGELVMGSYVCMCITS